jgi:plastocyanin
MKLGMAALVLAVVAIAATEAPRAQAADCAWHRHSKRVVKRVWRHGRPRRVVRVHRWWTCDPVEPTELPSQPLPPTEPDPGAHRLGVKAAEFYFLLSRPRVEPGEVTIELNNRGEDAHDLHLQLESGEGPVFELPETASLQQSSAQFDLPVGTYRLWCSLPIHEEAGMHATLTVAPG